MTTKSASRGIGHLVRALRAHDAEGCSDGQLLERFLVHQDEAAFAALVRRHGPMVFGVCRRVLGNDADSEDAFQATFLVLVRKAPSLTARAVLGDWLHGVARYTALKAKAAAAHRRAKEQVMARSGATAVDVRNDWLSLLDEELARLPEKYRLPIVLCDLEGKTRREAAGQLGWPEGTVAGRLTRARTMLAKGLARHGIVFSGGALAVALSQNAASACVPALTVSSTIKAATLLAAGKVVGVISPHVAALTEGVLKTMFLNKLKTVMTVLFLVLGLIVGSGGLYIHHAEAQQGLADKAPAAGETDKKKEELPPKQEKEAFTAWGKEVGGLQAGIGYRKGQKRAYAPGETVKLVVRVRNVSKDEVKFRYSKETFFETPPTVTDREGKPVSLKSRIATGFVALLEATLAPGKEIELAELKLEPRTSTQSAHEGQWNLFTKGKFRVWYDQLEDTANDKSLSKLATGKLEVEVKDAEELPQKQEKEREGFTAWGKEVGGLQAGLCFTNANDIQIGGKAKVVIKLRNVGKEAIFVSAWPMWLGPPRVVNTLGKPVRTTTPPPHAGIKIDPDLVILKPGRTIEFDRMDVIIAEFDQRVNFPEGIVDFFAIHVQPGKYKADCIGFLKEHPTLATGTVEFEVKPAKDENSTAWGKEVSGLQAGLGFRPGERRAYSHGETVTLVVRVRNVGKEPVKFSYLQPFIEHAPIVMDGEGKTVPQPTKLYEIGARLPGIVELAPGKEIELHELKRDLKPASESDSKRVRPEGRPHALYGTGKVSIQYKQVLGDPVMGYPGWKLDPALSKLATGKLEFEITKAR